MNENAKLWVEALRSGKYKQGIGYLKREDGRLCCLGVACELAIEKGLTIERGTTIHSGEVIPTFDGEKFYLPSRVMEWLGLKDYTGNWSVKNGVIANEDSNLAFLHDHGSTFADIANVIEQRESELFF